MNITEFSISSLDQLKNIQETKIKKEKKCPNPCIFCDLKKDKSLNVIENTPLKNDYFFILKDAYPTFETHYLVIPYEHIEDYVTEDSLYLKKAAELGRQFMKTFDKNISLNYSMWLNYTDWSYKIDPINKDTEMKQQIHHAHLHLCAGKYIK